MKHSWRAAAIASAVAFAVAMVGGTAFAAPRAHGSQPAWAPVPYRNAQLSVPGSWLVEAPQQMSCGLSRPGGMIFVGIRPRKLKGQGCGLSASLAWIVPAGHVPQGIRHRKPTAVLHGIPVYRLHSGKGSLQYVVPDLGVRVGASGPRSRRVLATLTRSPLSLVLRRGPSRKVPAGWTWRRFGGVRFATPGSWRLQHETRWATCGTGVESGSVVLINATRPPLYLPCPYLIPTAAADRAQPGLTVVTGTYAAKSVSENFGSCRVRHGIRTCLSSVTGQGGFLSGVLIFSVARPHRHAGTFFLLGLSGARARAVFDSVRAS